MQLVATRSPLLHHHHRMLGTLMSGVMVKRYFGGVKVAIDLPWHQDGFARWWALMAIQRNLPRCGRALKPCSGTGYQRLLNLHQRPFCWLRCGDGRSPAHMRTYSARCFICSTEGLPVGTGAIISRTLPTTWKGGRGLDAVWTAPSMPLPRDSSMVRLSADAHGRCCSPSLPLLTVALQLHEC